MERASIRIRGYIDEVVAQTLLGSVGASVPYALEQAELASHGHYSANIALVLAKKLGIPPRECAQKIVDALASKAHKDIQKLEIAGAGFINIFLSNSAVIEELKKYTEGFEAFPKRNQKMLIEYTDPNCFKIFHIGHLMANTIGESISRIYQGVGYDVMRVCYPSDIGRNVAMGVWGVMQKKDDIPGDTATLREKVTFLGECYTFANTQFETNPEAKEAIIEVNKAIYDKSDKKILEIYEKGRSWSLAYFDELYVLLGTAFDAFIYESEVSEPGLAIVREFLKKGIFEESEGAIVYKGERDGLHTRVFVNSAGLPTYEAKDLGNYEKKLKLLPDADTYVVITANEQNDYFKVINTVAEKIHPELAGHLVHVGHGLMRLPEGKMSSRKGNVIEGEELIELVAEKVHEKIKDFAGGFDEKAELADDIAIGALKFSILKQAPGKDTIFDMEKSLSFEGDSGPYLQYTHARMCALLNKADAEEIEADFTAATIHDEELERILLIYTDTVQKAYDDLGPQHIVNYLLLLTRAFNSLYARETFVDGDKKESGYYVALTYATRNVLAHGLNLLGIIAPERM